MREVGSYGEERGAVLQAWQTEQKDNGNITPSWDYADGYFMVLSKCFRLF
jgi:hypothetical protein